MAVGDIVRQLGISEQTFYRWKKQYGGMQSEGVRELKILQDENARLKKLVAELSPVSVEQEGPQAGAATTLARAGSVRVRWGYRRLHVLLKREGFQLGVNQTYRWYCLEQLQLHAWCKKRRKSAVARQARMQPRQANDAWSMDFVADQLADGTKIRLLTIIDIYSRESLAIVAGHRLRGDDVVAALNRIIAKRTAPKCLFVDNGREFSGQMLDLWAYHHHTKIDFSRPGKPTDNCYIETFNRSLRDECLNVHWFTSLTEVQAIVEAWRVDYNEIRPHMALNDQTPTAFARSAVSGGLEIGH